MATLRQAVNEPCLEEYDLEGWLWQDLTARGRQSLQCLLEAAMQTELTGRLGYQPYQRDPQLHTNYRNGAYTRSLDTQFGCIPDLHVPRARHGQTAYSVLERYSRRAPWVEDLVREMFLSGVSTRRVGRVVRSLLSASVSASAVSRIVASLDEQARCFHRRALPDEYEYLILDGVSLRVKGACGVNKCLALCVYGITFDGKRELIDYRLAKSESEREWTVLLESLQRRGLTGDRVVLVVTDGGQGLINAIAAVFGDLRLQRCWAHKMRNLANKLKAAQREPCLKQAAGIYRAANRRQAVQRYRAWEARWKREAAGAVACLSKDLDALLRFFSTPKAHWKKIRTTNAIERQFREVRRRTNPMTCFAHERSADRILYAIFHYANQRWAESPLKEFTHKS